MDWFKKKERFWCTSLGSGHLPKMTKLELLIPLHKLCLIKHWLLLTDSLTPHFSANIYSARSRGTVNSKSFFKNGHKQKTSQQYQEQTPDILSMDESQKHAEKIRQTQNSAYYMISFLWHSRTGKINLWCLRKNDCLRSEN